MDLEVSCRLEGLRGGSNAVPLNQRLVVLLVV